MHYSSFDPIRGRISLIGWHCIDSVFGKSRQWPDATLEPPDNFDTDVLWGDQNSP